MKAFRVMVNNLERGTDVHVDGLPSAEEAEVVASLNRAVHPDNNYFVQEYEEARVGRNHIEVDKQ